MVEKIFWQGLKNFIKFANQELVSIFLLKAINQKENPPVIFSVPFI
jgi:hypothetical protein